LALGGKPTFLHFVVESFKGRHHTTKTTSTTNYNRDVIRLQPPTGANKRFKIKPLPLPSKYSNATTYIQERENKRGSPTDSLPQKQTFA
jgi:hypothetical protein